MSKDITPSTDPEGLGYDEETDRETMDRVQMNRERRAAELRAQGIHVETQEEHRRKVQEREQRRKMVEANLGKTAA